MTGTDLFKLFAVSAVVMGISHSITKERIGQPLRNACGDRERFLGYLVSCPYCFSHWVAFVIVPITGAFFIEVPHAWGWLSTALSWFLSSILVTVVSAFLRVVFYFIDESQGLVRRQEKIVEAELDPNDAGAPHAPLANGAIDARAKMAAPANGSPRRAI